MNISIQHLDRAVSKLKYGLLGYSYAEKVDFQVTISLVQADPGTGVMTDCLVLKAVAPKDPEDKTNKETTMVIEVYPVSDNQVPRASKIETHPLNDKY